MQQDLAMRYDRVPSAADADRYPHLNSTTTVGTRQRRQAEIRGPEDRAALVSQAREQGRALPYVALSAASAAAAGTTHSLGRVSASPFGAAREQHYYDSSGSFTPYPVEGQFLEGQAAAGAGRQNVWRDLHRVSTGGAPATLTAHERHLQSVPTILNVSEPQRSPLMAAASNLEVANQAQTTGTPRSFADAFGQARGTVNIPGTIAATGSGAVHQFDAVDNAIAAGDIGNASLQRRVTRAPQGMRLPQARNLTVRRRDNLLRTVRERIDMTDTDRAMQEPTRTGRDMAVRMRVRSGIDRAALRPMGLSRYDYRPLVRTAAAAPAMDESGYDADDERE
jgi:hypothetical protein